MQTDTPVRKTALCEVHQRLKAKLIPFAGWLMPVSYTSVLAEHKAVREACGLFDVSHMGEIFVTGQDAEAYLQRMTINDVSRLKPGSGQYTAILDSNGGFIDDLIIYRLADTEFLICANASNIDKDFAWLTSHASHFARVLVKNRSDAYSQIAVQGPTCRTAMAALPGFEALAAGLQYMQILPFSFFGQQGYIARTGYTGEVGYELYLPNAAAEQVWTTLLETRAKSGIQPVGLGARDTLRLESGYLLYGNDMNETVSPLEAGIGWAVRMEGRDFIGRDALIRQQKSGIPRQMVAFKMTEDGIPRHDMDVYVGDECVGRVTSGSVLPTVGGAGGMALIKSGKAGIGDTITVDVRGKRKLAQVVQKPLYKPKIKS